MFRTLRGDDRRSSDQNCRTYGRCLRRTGHGRDFVGTPCDVRAFEAPGTTLALLTTMADLRNSQRRVAKATYVPLIVPPADQKRSGRAVEKAAYVRSLDFKP